MPQVAERLTMPYWLQAEIKDGAFSVAGWRLPKTALVHLAKLTEADHTDVAATNSSSTIIELSTLPAEEQTQVP